MYSLNPFLKNSTPIIQIKIAENQVVTKKYGNDVFNLKEEETMKKSGLLTFRKPGTWLNGFSVLLLFCLLTVFFIGCSGNALEFMADDNSKEAKLEEAMIALNDEDFDKAVSILEDMDPNDPDVKKYLSNAYSGQAGLDTFSLIETIQAINDSPSEGSIDLVGMILTDDHSGIFTGDEIDDKIAKFDKAIEAMLGIHSGTSKAFAMVNALTVDLVDLQEKLEDPDIENDVLVQLGLLGLNHAILSIAKIVLNDLEVAGITEITLTEAWLKAKYPDASHISIELTDEQQALLDSITLDLNLLSASIDALLDVVGDDNNELQDAFDEFLGKIDSNNDLMLTSAEFENYINNL